MKAVVFVVVVVVVFVGDGSGGSDGGGGGGCNTPARIQLDSLSLSLSQQFQKKLIELNTIITRTRTTKPSRSILSDQAVHNKLSDVIVVCVGWF